MFMNDVNKKEEIRNVAVKELRSLGIKFRPKKPRRDGQEMRIGRRVFKTAIHLLPTQTVTLLTGQQLVIPKLVHELCSFILTKVETEGLFRKAGSKARQNEIKLSLDAGCSLSEEHHEVDVANVLKTFFRELPEPLFPYSYHETFLRCMILEENKLQALLLTCLLLPCEHLNTIAYFMQFLKHVTEFSMLNKMDSYNLAVVIGPTIFPMEEKVAANSALRVTKICELFKLLIENGCDIGVVTENIIDRIAPISPLDVSDDKRKKKRRSGSLTRMFNGLRKIVGSKLAADVSEPVQPAPDLIATPVITKSTKKRKIEPSGLSNKKKRELLQSLPQGTALGTPVNVNPKAKEKRLQWNLGSRRGKKTESESNLSSLSTKSSLQRRWSAVSQAAGLRRTKPQRASSMKKEILDPSIEAEDKLEPEYVKISRQEYEEIKCRVSEIERRISVELENYKDSSLETNNSDVIGKVQTAYEKTLVESEPLSPTTDQLAKRLSKELKIRRSEEQKVMRSPSARKIGSLRRRSRDRAKVQRNQSWHVERSRNLPRVSLKRGKPNTVFTGLPQPSPHKSKLNLELANQQTLTNQCEIIKLSPLKSCSISTSKISCNSSGCLEKWSSAEGFFTNFKTPDDSDNCRASIMRLRSQNAGMVLAKARLFDGLLDSDNSPSSQSSTASAPVRARAPKIGAVRNQEKLSYRVKNLRCDDRRLKSISPRRRMRSPRNAISAENMQLSADDEKENVKSYNPDFLGSSEKTHVLKDCNRLNVISPPYTPIMMPQIKKSLAVKTPKRLCRTPTIHDVKTPLKILATKTVY